MSDTSPQAERIVAVEQTVIALKYLLEEREKLHAEFRLRTDLRLETLLKQSDEWNGVRKTLLMLLSVISVASAVIGWLLSHLTWGNLKG